MSRRWKPRDLTADEREVWSRVAKATDPLHPVKKKPAPTPKFQPHVTVADLKSSAAPMIHRPTPRRAEPLTSFHPAPETITDLSRETPGLDKRTAERLRKGRTPPEARLDLHGMTADRAHNALIQFIQGASQSGKRCVLVITGKGGPTTRHNDDAEFMSDQRGVLRRNTPRWLRSAPLSHLVVGIYQAHAKHGGAGALYVYLKRQR